MVKIKIFDTFEGKIKEFKPIKEGEVSIYYCGPTVYDYGHLGNFKVPVFFDLVHRFFKAVGYKVKMVSNYTDIDDKIIKKATSTNKTEKEVSEFYIKDYENNLNLLNVLPLYNNPKVSNYMNDIIEFIDLSLKKDASYKSGEDIYFDVSKIDDYGSLSKMNIEELDAGKRISVSEKKHSPFDFALWKMTDDQGIKFDAPFGRGRPGWHTECLVMINKIFNSPLIDIHGGGFDLKFPHHENERAQSKAVYNSNLANYWMHVGFMNFEDTKMSKSLGNVIAMRDLLKELNPDVFRLFILKANYRAPLSFSQEAIDTTKIEVEKYRSVKKSLNLYLATNKLNDKVGTLIESYYDSFIDALANDFNVANGLTAFDSLVKNINTSIRQKDNKSILDLKFTFDKINDILGLRLKTAEISEEILSIYSKYEEARNNKDYELSDIYRKKLIESDVL